MRSRVAVFENQHDDSTWLSATLSRTYRDDNGNYKTTHSLNGVADLVLASRSLGPGQRLHDRDRETDRSKGRVTLPIRGEPTKRLPSLSHATPPKPKASFTSFFTNAAGHTQSVSCVAFQLEGSHKN